MPPFALTLKRSWPSLSTTVKAGLLATESSALASEASARARRVDAGGLLSTMVTPPLKTNDPSAPRSNDMMGVRVKTMTRVVATASRYVIANGATRMQIPDPPPLDDLFRFMR